MKVDASAGVAVLVEDQQMQTGRLNSKLHLRVIEETTIHIKMIV